MARPLPDYYKTKCEFSGEDAPWKFLTYKLKMAFIIYLNRPDIR